MKAIIICDDSAFAAKSRVLLRRVGDRPGVNVRWAIKTWPVNALLDPGLSERALLGGADAHLVVIPGKHAQSLSSHLRVWLNRWAALRQLRDAAVGVIGDDDDSGAIIDVSLELRLLVQRHGLSLIHDEAAVSKDRTRVPVRFPLKREQPLPIRFAHLPDTAMLDVFRGFGINE